jgi:hypothetical protein
MTADERITALQRQLERILRENALRTIDFFQLEGRQAPVSLGSWKASLFLIDENDPRGRHQLTIGEGDFADGTLKPRLREWFAALQAKHQAQAASVDLFIDPF